MIVNAVEGADHYDIYRTVNGKTVLAGSTASGKLVFKDKKAASLKGIKRASYRAVAVSKDANVKASDNGAAKTVKFTANVKIKKAAASRQECKTGAGREIKSKLVMWIYRSTKKKPGYKRIKKINNNKTVSYQDKKIRKKGNYYYKIVTVKKEMQVQCPLQKGKREIKSR